MKDGFTGIALILLIASSRVPSALGLAGLSNPTWLSLICRKGTPPGMVHRTPVPAQVMHSRTLRRLRFFALGSLVLDVIVSLHESWLPTMTRLQLATFYSPDRKEMC